MCKSNSNSYHDGTSAFFNIFFENDLNVIEIITLIELVRNKDKRATTTIYS